MSSVRSPVCLSTPVAARGGGTSKRFSSFGHRTYTLHRRRILSVFSIIPKSPILLPPLRSAPLRAVPLRAATVPRAAPPKGIRGKQENDVLRIWLKSRSLSYLITHQENIALLRRHGQIAFFNKAWNSTSTFAREKLMAHHLVGQLTPPCPSP